MRCVPYLLLSARLAVSIASYIPVHVLWFLKSVCCVAGTLAGPRPPHYADLDRDGHVVRGSFRGYHRGRGRVMHGKLILALNSDVVSGCEKQGQLVTCLLFAICLVHITIEWAASLLHFWEDLVLDLSLETISRGRFSLVFRRLSNQVQGSFVVFLSCSEQLPELYPLLGHSCFVTHILIC